MLDILALEIAMPGPVDKDSDKSLNIEFILGCLVYALNVHYWVHFHV